MAVIGFSFFFTLIAIGLLGYLVAFWVLIALAAVLLIAVIIRRRRLSVVFAVAVASAMVACAFFCVYTNFVYKRVVSYADRQLELRLEITDIQGEENGAYYYTARVVNSEHRSLNGAKIRLSSSTPLDVEVCDVVSASVTTRLAGSALRSSQLHYKSSGIFLKAHIPEAYEVEKNPDKSLGYYFYSIRQSISEIISANLSSDSAGVVNSILLGDTSGLDYKDNLNFRNIGVSHIFCVSGLHVTLISAMIYKALSALIDKKRVLYGATIAAIWFFVAVTGFSYSSIRSGVMLTIYYLGCMIGRRSDSLNSLGAAALIVCLLNPFSATNVSVLYSFFATLAMIIIPTPRIRVRSRLVRSVLDTAMMSLSVAVMTLPIQIYFFGTATLASPIANCFVFFAVPILMSCAVVGVLLSLFTSILSAVFFSVSSAIARYLILISEAIADFPYTTIDASNGFVRIFVVIAVIVIASLVYFRAGKRKIALLSCICTVMLLVGALCNNFFFSPVMSATVIDSGSATSVVVTSGSGCVVIGCGGRGYTANEVAYQLQQGCVRDIDLLILPSRDTSDVMNLTGLSEMTDINAIICGEDYGLVHTLGLDNFKVSREGEAKIDDMLIRYSYGSDHRLTYIEVGESSVLVVSMISDGYEVGEPFQNADVVITAGEHYTTNNEKVNILCTTKDGDYPVTEVCYRDGGNIEIEFSQNGSINCERRA